jgi:magnesium transporter
MPSEIMSGQSQHFKWIDVSAPTREELDKIAEQYGIHSNAVQDCLDPEHLPKVERMGEINFIILRAHDPRCGLECDTAQELTTKVAMFVGKDFLITIHRKEQEFIKTLRTQFETSPITDRAQLVQLVADIIHYTILSYEKPIDDAEHRVEQYEMKVFKSEAGQNIIREGYFLKRKSAVFKKMMRLTLDLLPRISIVLDSGQSPVFQNLKEEADRLYFYSDDLMDNMSHLISVHITIDSHRTNEASHRTNEVMRVLTVFSVFFMPLNFIAGVYGMNFKYMPELESYFGYPIVLSAMLVVSVAIFTWFWRKGWLK